MKAAYTHDWLSKFAGAEVVLSAMEEVLVAPIYTLFYTNRCAAKIGVSNSSIHPSFLQSIPAIDRNYKNFLPLYPLAVRNFDLSQYDLVISSSHSAAKGFRKRERQMHICYCHTPMRYVWDLYDDYKNAMPFYKKMPFSVSAGFIRKWDYNNSKNVDFFIANSKFVAERIKRIYGRESKVIYPPVDVDQFKPETKKEDYYLFVGRLLNAYKRTDIVIKAFNTLGKRLIVVGDGDDMRQLKSIAGDNIKFVGWLDTQELGKIMSKAKALILPSIEDFGIVSVESQACGTPVIAYRKGGAVETVIEGETGLFFDRQTPENIVETVNKFENQKFHFDIAFIRDNADRFSKKRFQKKFKNFLSSTVDIGF